MSISLADARHLYTSMLVDVYQEREKPTSFLQSFFPDDIVPTKSFSIQVERMGELVAVDVVRGTEGNRNTFTKSTEKLFEPPYFREYLDMTEFDLYDVVLGSMGNGRNFQKLFTVLLNTGAERLATLVDKIERAKEIQCAEVLKLGTVTMTQGVTAQINYRRKAASFYDVSANYFTAASDPFATLQIGCDFLRTVGKSGDATFSLLMGSDVATALLTNAKFLTRQNLFSMALDSVVAPAGTRNAEGYTYHGTLTCGAYKVQLFAYPQFYDTVNADGTLTPNPYWDPKYAVLLPSKPRFKMVHCAVPQLIGEPGQLPAQGKYVYQEFLDERRAKHILDVQTAPVPVPVAVDQMWTAKLAA